MGIVVREAGAGDIGLVMEWRERVLREVFSLDDDADLSAVLAGNESYYRRNLVAGTAAGATGVVGTAGAAGAAGVGKGHTAVFAFDGGGEAPIGCGGICYQEELPSPDNPSGRNGYLMNIYTIPSARGRGVGRAIVEYLVADAKANGAGKVYLESSAMAKGLYRGLGFADMHDYMALPQGRWEAAASSMRRSERGCVGTAGPGSFGKAE